VINERVVVGDGKTTPAKTPLSETILNAMRKRGFQFVGPVIVYASGTGNDGPIADAARRAQMPALF
jgi:DNA-3-methyladenine glycosylase I